MESRAVRGYSPAYVKRALVAACLLSGCTAEHYRQSADLDVRTLLRQSQEQTLSYAPSTDLPPTTAPAITSQAYDRVPVSPVPPPAPSPLEPSPPADLSGPLGPQDLFPPGSEMLRFRPMDIATARAPALALLRLGPPAELQNGPVFGLFESLAYAVQHSREYQNRLEELYLAALDVTLQRHLFAPRPFVEQRLSYRGGQEDVSFRSALSAATSAGVRQQLPYGGELVAQGLVDFVNALNDTTAGGESASAALSASVPLLRGAGMVNLEGLIQSERDLVYAVRRFEDFRRAFVVDVCTRYFRLLTQQQAIANRRTNYITLAELTERTQALFAAGRLNFLQVQRAEQSQLSAEQQVIVSQTAYDRQLDDFKTFIGMPVDQPLSIAGVELEVVQLDLASLDAETTALQFRLDLRTALDQMDDAQRRVKVAENRLLPDLTLAASSSVGNRDETPAAAFDSRTTEYSAGLTLDLPVDRLPERNAYRRALISLERARRNADSVRDRVLIDVRAAVRNIAAARLSVEIQRQSIELARQRVDFATERLIQGRLTDSREVTDAQSALLDAQDAFDRARADLQIQILEFLRDTGTLRVDPGSGAVGRALDRPGLRP